MAKISRAASPAQPPPWAAHAPALAGIALLAAAFAAFWPSLGARFVWDDNAHLTPGHLAGVDGLLPIWFSRGATPQYYPLLHTFFWLEHTLWGYAPLGYHVANVLLHAAASWLLFLILRKLDIPGALLATGLFALHPVQVETVAWIAEQKNTLSAVFYFGALLAWLRFDERRANLDYGLATLLFACALLSNSVTATLPGAALVIIWWKRGRLEWKRDVWPVLPWLALGAAAGLHTVLFEVKFAGAAGPEFDLGFAQRVLLAGRALWFYVAQLAWPSDLMFTYPRWTLDSAVWWQWLYPAATLAALVALWALRKRSRAPLACALYFAGTLFPVLGFFNVYPFVFSYVADHFQYLACAGVFVPLAAGATHAARRWRGAAARAAVPVAAAGVLAALGALSWHQSGRYADDEALYRATLVRNPESWLAHSNLGSLMLARGRIPDALRHFSAALALRDSPEAYNSLGNALLRAGQIDDAMRQYAEAIRRRDPYPEAYLNMGNALRAAGKNDFAERCYREAARQRPFFPEAHLSLGQALDELKRDDDALAEFNTALAQRPGYGDAHNALGNFYFNRDKFADAAREYEAALAAQPGSAHLHNNLGSALLMLDRLADAQWHYEQALRIAPGYSAAQQNLVLVREKRGLPPLPRGALAPTTVTVSPQFGSGATPTK